MPDPASQASPLAPEVPASAPRWLRIGLLLFIAQALALCLQALLLVHKEGELLVGITVSRIGIAADQVDSAFARASANGLLLGEARGLARMLPSLIADDSDIAAIHIFDAANRHTLFATDTTPSPPDASAAILKKGGTWFHLDPAGPLHVGQRLTDTEGRIAGGVLFTVKTDTLQARRQATRNATLARLGLTLAGVAAALPLLLRAVARFGRQRFGLRLRLLAAALLLAGASSLALSLQALPSFSEQLSPALDAKAHSLARLLAGRIGNALALGIPFDKLNGVEDYFDDTLERHPEILAFHLEGPGHSYSAERPGRTGSRIEVPVAGNDGRLIAQLAARTDADVVARELRDLAIDMAIVYLVALVLFNEALGAILASGELAPVASRARLGLARLAVFLLILSEELTRAFMPLHIASLADTGGHTGSTAISLPISAYMLSFALLTPFAGRWAERFGVARTFAVGAGLSTLGFGWAMLAGDYWAFVAARCLCAAGYAVGTMAMQQHFMSAAAAGERTRALALYVGALQTAAICGSAVGGLLAERFGAAAVFAGAAALGALALAVQRLDTLPPLMPGNAPPGRLLATLRNPAVLVPLLTAAIPVKLVLAGFLFYLVPLALRQEGYGSSTIGRALMVYFILVTAANPVASWLSDRFGWNRQLVAIGGLSIAAGGLAGLVGGPPALIAGVIALGIGTGLGAAALQSMVGREGPAALVLLRAGERLGAVIGPLLASSLLTLMAYGGAMAAIGSVVLAATFVFMLSGRTKETSP